MNIKNYKKIFYKIKATKRTKTIHQEITFTNILFPLLFLLANIHLSSFTTDLNEVRISMNNKKKENVWKSLLVASITS